MLTTRQLVHVLIEGMKILEKHKDKATDAELKAGLKRIQRIWRRERPPALYTQN